MSIFAAHPALVQGHQTLLLTGIAFGYSLFAMSTATSSRYSSEAVVFTQNIRIFYAVSLCHSFTAAARQLVITQSAVSQGIAALEKQLDLELFDRTRRPLALCPEGQLLRDLVARQMGEADTVIDVIRTRNFIPNTIRVGVVESVGRRIAVRLVQEMLVRGRRIEITTGYADDLYEQLFQDKLDCIIANGFFFDAPNLTHRFLLSEPYVVMLPAEVAGTRTEWSWESLSLCGVPLVRYAGSTRAGKDGEAVLRHADLDLPQRFCVDDNQTVFSLVAAGLGWCLTNPLTALLAAEFREEVKLLPAPDASEKRELYVVSKNSTPRIFADDVFEIADGVLRSLMPEIDEQMPWVKDAVHFSAHGQTEAGQHSEI